MGKKISELVEATEITENDYLVIDDGSTTKKTKAGNIINYDATDVSEIGEVKVIAGYDGNKDSATLKNLNGDSIFPNPNFVGIDTDNILATGNLLPYTVQEDCFITSFSNDGGNGHYILKIDNFKFVDSGTVAPRQSWCFAKKGQVISADTWYVTPIITVYGLKY